MAFWNDAANVRPKQAFRWFVSFGDLELEANDNKLLIPTFACKSVTKPSYTIKTNPYKLLGAHTFHFPTSLEWQPISFKFYDVVLVDQIFNNFISLENVSGDTNVKVNRSTQQFFYSILSKAGYVNPNEGARDEALLRFRKSLFKRDLVDAITSEKTTPENQNQHDSKTVQIHEIDPNGNKTETWKLYNAQITKVTFGDLSYESENVVEIGVDLTYDWAELELPEGKGGMFDNFELKNLESGETSLARLKTKFINGDYVPGQTEDGLHKFIGTEDKAEKIYKAEEEKAARITEELNKSYVVGKSRPRDLRLKELPNKFMQELNSARAAAAPAAKKDK